MDEYFERVKNDALQYILIDDVVYQINYAEYQDIKNSNDDTELLNRLKRVQKTGKAVLSVPERFSTNLPEMKRMMASFELLKACKEALRFITPEESAYDMLNNAIKKCK